MKNFKYILLFTPAFLFAQNNLFFNRVINFQISPGGSITVPEGKAWNVIQGNINVGSPAPPYGDPLIGSFGYPNPQNYSETYTKIWLGEGQSLRSNISNTQAINLIEYDVIPIGSGTTGGSNSSAGFTSSTDFIGSGQYTTTNDYTVADSFTDIDGNEYGAINLNGNIWSSSDLKVTKFTDGTPIPLSTSITDFRNTSKAAYFINNGTYLYNWQAIVGEHDGNGNTELKKLAPEGYRIPSKADWNILTDFYGGEMFAAHYLMSKTSWPGGKNGINKSGLNLKNISAYAKNGLSSTTTSFSLAWATKSLYYRPSNKYQLFWAFTLAINNGASNGYETKLSEIFATYSSTLGVVTGYEQNSGVAVRVVKEY